MSCTLKEVAEFSLDRLREITQHMADVSCGASNSKPQYYIGVKHAHEGILSRITGTTDQRKCQSFIDKMEGGGE